MATTQTLALNCASNKPFTDTYPVPLQKQYSGTVGSVGSLIKKPDILPERIKGKCSRPRAGSHQHEGLLKKGFARQELLNYLNSRMEPNANKRITADFSPFKSKCGAEYESVYSKVYHKKGKEVLMNKNSPPVELMKSHLKRSTFISNKNFSSMQNLCPAKAGELENNLANGPPVSCTKVIPTSVGSSLSPSYPDQGNRKTATYSLSQDEETMSDSGHNSMNSLPPYWPPFQPHLSQISASMGHINHSGSWDHSSFSSRSGTFSATDMPRRSMVTLNRLWSCGSEASQSCELSCSLEGMVQDLEDQLLEKEHELKQMRKNLDESEDAIVQVFEGKQRLWEKEVEELKRLYATKLRQLSHYAQHSQHTLQLQLYKVQQDRQRLQEDLEALQRQYQILKGRHPDPNSQDKNLQIEESQWEVCQKSGEIALLKQQLRDSQAQVTQKLSEIFHLKTRLHETQSKMRAKDNKIDKLQLVLQQESHHVPKELPETLDGKGGPRGTAPGDAEDRLRAELILERRQSEAQASAFEAERHTWHMEKEKVICYQKELQASYLEMYHRNQVLEQELLLLKGGSGRDEGFSGGDQLPSGLPWLDRIESSEI